MLVQNDSEEMEEMGVLRSLRFGSGSERKCVLEVDMFGSVGRRKTMET